MVNQLEERVASLKQQHEQLRKDVEARLEEKNQVIESTRQENRKLREFLSKCNVKPQAGPRLNMLYLLDKYKQKAPYAQASQADAPLHSMVPPLGKFSHLGSSAAFGRKKERH